MPAPIFPRPRPTGARANSLGLSFAIPALFAFASLLHAGRAMAEERIQVYDDQLRNGFQDWSWATHDLASTDQVHGGSFSVSMLATDWEGLYFHNGTSFDAATHDRIEMWVHGGTSGGQAIRCALYSAGSEVAGGLLAPFVEGGAIPAGAWARALVPVGDLGLPQGAYDSIVLQSFAPGDQGTLFFDDIALLIAEIPPEPVTVTVDPTADRHPISPLIYGVSLGDSADFATLPYTSRRWGGNHTTRYSWMQDTSNRGSDWFFISIAEPNGAPGDLPDGSAADRFLDETLGATASPILTIPMIGWTPRDRVKRWAFSIAKYGAQELDECDWLTPPYCAADAGNGVRPGGEFVTGNDPSDTSLPIGPDFVVDWKRHIEERVGSAAEGGLRFLALDNEPMLWNSTHRDVHPDPATYDEVWQKTVDYASALKAHDPAVEILGPVVWGWCAYFHSALDGCAPGQDQAAHGGMEFLPWYLERVRDYEQQHGTRLVDYLDIHYYPQAPDVAFSEDESPGTSALRLRSVRSLHDPSYVDESWIGQPVRLIPRMKDWIAEHAPGMKLAVTEYNWGSDDGISSALAQAEVLAVFGREGVDLATRWVAPESGTRSVDAFRMYLDYDGSGTQVRGESVRAVSTNDAAVASYAVDAPGPDLHVLLFNKAVSAMTVTVRVGGGAIAGGVDLYRFEADMPFGPAGRAEPSGDSFALVLPERSATLAVVRQGDTAGGGGVDGGGPLIRSIAPSPFREGATIHVRLPRAGSVRLRIHDITGRMIRTLVEEDRVDAGVRTVFWNGIDDEGRPVPSGVFLVRLECGAETETRRFLRVR